MSDKRGPYRKCYLVPHRTGFKYCRAVPKDLQAIEGKQAWVKYLGPVSRVVAETMAHALAYEHGRRILALRGGTLVGAEVTPPRIVVSPRTAVVPPSIKVMDLVSIWERVRTPRSEISRRRSRLCARRFIELVGDIDVRIISRFEAAAYRDGLEDLFELKPGNISDHLERMHVLFSVALAEGLLIANPFENIRPRQADKLAQRRQGFTTEQVRAIFAALDGESFEFSWIVKLLAYHGMRSGEACQLRCNDVAELHGVSVLRIHDLYGSVKNRPSVRDVPLHPACQELQAYSSELRRKGEGWLFPQLPTKALGRGRWFQDYASRFLRQKVGITERCYTMHSFRHLWRTLSREIEMPESVSRSIMGHTVGGGEHGAYGAAPSLRARHRWLSKIDPLA